MTEQPDCISNEEIYSINTKQDYNLSFHNDNGLTGKLDFNGPSLIFIGNAEVSAKIFIDWLMVSFRTRLYEERERCAKLCQEVDKSTHPSDLADAIRNLE